MTDCTGFVGYCQMLTVPDNPYLLGAFLFLSIVIVIRIVRWVLDILP
jgi:hypothetical protein